MTLADLALVVYSAQIVLVVAAASVIQRLIPLGSPGARLVYWRIVGGLCVALPLLSSAAAARPPLSVTFGEATISLPRDAAMLEPTAGARTLLFWIWACGAAAGVARLLAGAWRLRVLRASSEPATASDDRLEALKAELAPHAVLRWSDAVSQPVTFGVRRPIVLLPRRFAGLDADARHAVVRHELLHVRRRDWLWIVIEEHLRALCWFHPAAWWLIDRIQLSREQLLDHLVVSRTSSRRAYMQALVTFADAPRSTLLSIAFLRRRHLRSRLRELAKESQMPARHLRWRAALVAVAVSCATAATVRALPLDVASLARQDSAPSRVEIRLAQPAPAPGLQEAVVSGSGRRIYLHPTVLATDADVTSAQVVETGPSQFGVGLTFSESASARMARESAANVGKMVAISVDDAVVAALTLRAPISGSAMITGLTSQAAEALAAQLAPAKAPPEGVRGRLTLPVPITQVRPQYTSEALTAGIQGAVLLEVVVLADGSAGDVTVVKSLDAERGLDRQAIDALKQWTWKPGMVDGAAQRVAVRVEMTFTLK